MLNKILTAFTFSVLSCQSLADVNQDLASLIDQHWQNAQQEKVFFRTDPDGWKPNGKLAEWTPQAIARREAYNQQVLSQLSKIDKDALNQQQLMNYRLFKYERETEALSHQFQDKYFPINFLSGWHTYFAEAPANMAFLTSQDYDNFLVSLADYPRFNQENINLMKAGLKAGYVHHCESFKDYQQTISKHIVKNPKDSALFEPFTRFPATFSSQQISTYTAKAIELIT